MSTNSQNLVEDMKEIQENLGTIVGTVNDPATAEQFQNLMNQLTTLTDKMVSTQTTPQTIISKLKSRKFWMALLGAVTGLCGMLSSGGNLSAILIFMVLEVISICGYIFAEGTIDSTRTKELMQMATQIATIIGDLTPMMLEAQAVPMVIEEEPVQHVHNNDGEYDIPNTPAWQE